MFASSISSRILLMCPLYAISRDELWTGTAISVRRIIVVWILLRSLLLSPCSLKMLVSGVLGRVPEGLVKEKAVSGFCDWVLVLPEMCLRWLGSSWWSGGPRVILGVPWPLLPWLEQVGVVGTGLDIEKVQVRGVWSWVGSLYVIVNIQYVVVLALRYSAV